MIPPDALACQNLLLSDYFVTPGLQGEAARSARRRPGGGRPDLLRHRLGSGGLPRRHAGDVRSLLRSVDVFLPNEAEACALAGLAPTAAEQAAATLQRDCGGWVVVKLGARGCLAAGPDGARHAAAAPAVNVADTTGAGDAFNAGLVHALSDGSDWPAALEAATSFASAIIARPSRERAPPLRTAQPPTELSLRNPGSGNVGKDDP